MGAAVVILLAIVMIGCLIWSYALNETTPTWQQIDEEDYRRHERYR
jgi:hypothetical protein